MLGSPEAINNPLYRKVQDLDLEADLKSDIMRWLAWGSMGTGILANWLAFPMASFDDPMLVYLRHGEYPKLTRFEGLDNGLFVGEKDDVRKVIDLALSSQQPIKASFLPELVPKETFKTDSDHDAIAFYSTEVILQKYKGLAAKLQATDPQTRGEAMALLPQLVTSHLHTTCLLYTSPSPRDGLLSRMPSSA